MTSDRHLAISTVPSWAATINREFLVEFANACQVLTGHIEFCESDSYELRLRRSIGPLDEHARVFACGLIARLAAQLKARASHIDSDATRMTRADNEGKLEEIVSDLARSCAVPVGVASGGDRVVSIRSQRGAQAIRIVDMHVSEALAFLQRSRKDCSVHLASAARHVGISPSHLDRLLKRDTGLTFLQHLHAMRTKLACQLLANTTGSIKEIAFASGYRSVASLDRAFKRSYGCSPQMWRRKRA